jgi:hypothetical protein
MVKLFKALCFNQKLIPGHAGFVPSPGLSSLVEDFDGQLVLNALLADKGCVGIDDSGSVFDVELALLIAEDDVVVQFSVDALKEEMNKLFKIS